jgi:hypothetical protein
MWEMIARQTCSLTGNGGENVCASALKMGGMC